MATGRELGMRGCAGAALLIQLFLVGLVPLGEASHDHVHSLDAAWHADGADHDGESHADCAMECGQLSSGLTPHVAIELVASAVARAEVHAPVAEAPREARRVAIAARGPPA